MKKSQQLEQVKTPDGHNMGLFEHDGTYVIRVDGRELMSTRHYASEEKLAAVACAPLSKKPSARVLIGGLGLGFTLRAALKHLPHTAKVVVAELIPEVVGWNKNTNYPLAAKELQDPRTEIIIEDVARIIQRSAGTFDAIMLDADNGTTAMNSAGNRYLYAKRGLEEVYAALKPGGLAVYWSAQAEPIFAKHMGAAGFKVEVQRAHAHAQSGGQHTLLVGKRI